MGDAHECLRLAIPHHRLKDQMHMVGHDGVVEEKIALPIEEAQSANHQELPSIGV
jgi:hypothetical protein